MKHKRDIQPSLQVNTTWSKDAWLLYAIVNKMWTIIFGLPRHKYILVVKKSV